MLRKHLQLLTLIGRLFHNLCEWMDHERTQGVLWSSLILSLIIVLLLALGCASPIYNNSKSQFAVGYGQGENYNRSAISNIDEKNVGPQLEVLAAAEQDASRDVNKLLWFSAGLGSAVTIGPLGTYAGGIIGQNISGGVVMGTLARLVVGATAPIFLIDNYDPDPPSERLIGKSSGILVTTPRPIRVKRNQFGNDQRRWGVFLEVVCLVWQCSSGATLFK